MNYERIYNNIIERAKTRKLQGYKEKHHIIPRCMNGTNDKSNLVELTAKEHYLCHKLLTFIYPGNPKLIFAFWRMCTGKNKNQQRYKVTARIYKKLREEYAKAKSAEQKGRPSNRKGVKTSEETKEKQRESKKKLYANGYISHSLGKSLNFKQIWIDKGMTEEEAQKRWDEKLKKQSEFMKREDNPFHILEQTPERRKMLSERAKKIFTGSKQSEEHKKKRALAYKETYYNDKEAQKKRKILNKLNRQKQLELLKQTFKITLPNLTEIVLRGGYKEISETLLKTYNVQVLPGSLSCFIRGKIKFLKCGIKLEIIPPLQSNIE